MHDIDNRFSFSPALVEDAVAFKSGNFVEVDDIIYEANNLGRKIVQTQLVRIGGKEVSVGITGGDTTPHYDLIVASDNPEDLGSFESIIRGNGNIFQSLHQAFGGSPCGYTPLEMVVAIRAAVAANTDISDAKPLKHLTAIASDARASVKRGSWIASNHVTAFAKAPLDWRQLGL